MKLKLFILTLLMAVTLSAEALKQRTYPMTIKSSTPNYPECTIVVEVTETENPYIPNSWQITSTRVIQNTCGDPCSNCVE